MRFQATSSMRGLLNGIDSKFGWLQGVRNLLRQNSFWLQRLASIRIG